MHMALSEILYSEDRRYLGLKAVIDTLHLHPCAVPNVGTDLHISRARAQVPCLGLRDIQWLRVEYSIGLDRFNYALLIVLIIGELETFPPVEMRGS